MNKRVMIVAPVHEVLLTQLRAMGYEIDSFSTISAEKAASLVHLYEGVVTSTRLHLDRNFLDKAVNLKWVARMGSGMEIIDAAYAETKGIQCFSSPDGNANAVAEQALGMLLALQHRIVSSHLQLQQGIWQRDENRGTEIEGLKAGIIGYGHNGGLFAKKLLAMGLEVLAYDKYKKGYGSGISDLTECTDLGAIYEGADVLSFHLPLKEETRHFFNSDFLRAMKKPFILLNLSRGSVVETNALLSGMKEGKILAAALDVWEEEPATNAGKAYAEAFDYLIAQPNFIGTPHIGGYTHQATYKMSQSLASQLAKLEF